MPRYTRRDFLKVMGAGTAALTVPAWLYAADAHTEKLNFVFILIDDMGWMDAGCYGSTFYETPNINRLANEGVRFTDAYAACPVCSPTRASILSGKYPARINLTNFIGGYRPGKLIPAEHIRQLPLEELTMAEAFKKAGYATCFVGKWHLGQEPYYPEHQGFDINIAGSYRGQPPSYFYPYERGDNSLNLPGGKEGEYLTDRLTGESLKFLDANKDKPFLLYLSHYAVHTPLQSKEDLTDKYKTKAENLPPHERPRFLPEGKRQARQVQDHPVYAGMVQSVDESVGRVMKKLDELGVANNTAIIFMSDNGGLSTSEGSPTSNVPLRAGKGWLYEGGIREPMIIKWPGVSKPGSICSEPVTSTDFYPTMLEMAGIPLMPVQHCDGVSLVPMLKGAKSLDRKAIFWHYPHYGNQGGSPSGAVRAGDYKLIEWYEDGHVELYNLRKDIGEKNDLAAEMPEKTAQLREMLHDWRKEVDALMPTPNPRYDNKKKGTKDGEFDLLRNAAVDGSVLGYTLRAHWKKTGVALKKIKKALKKRATFKFKLQTTAQDATRNGFLAFGNGTEDKDLVKCGMYLGGWRYYAILDGPFENPKMKTCKLELDPMRVFDIEVTFDVQNGTVEMTADGNTINMTLDRDIDAVTHFGYCTLNALTNFSPVEISGE